LKNRIFSIEDEGGGIKKEDQKSIFNRFERKSKEQGGFGIGLDIVKSICKMYDIKFWVHSQLQKGSTFYLQFS
jgi:two-component system OmpR family sensor kinase